MRPVYTGHSLSISAGFKNQLVHKQRETLSDLEAVILDDVPTPDVGEDPTYVGRIRPSTVLENGSKPIPVDDNLRKGDSAQFK